MDTIFDIVLNANATKKNRERIKNHGSMGFTIRKRLDRCSLFDNEPAILMQSVVQDHDGHWCGWFRERDITLVIKITIP